MKKRIVLVTGWTNPERHSIVEIAMKLLNILEPFSETLTWIVTNLKREVSLDNNISLKRIENKYISRDASAMKLIPYYLLHQCKVMLAICKLLPKADIFVFAQGSDLLFLPILLARLSGKKIILRSDGRWSLGYKLFFQKVSKIKMALLQIGETISYLSANIILSETKSMINTYNMKRYGSKLCIGSQYVDTSIFKETKNLAERTYEIGFIGRLTKEKGALEFANSLPPVLKDRAGKVIIIGDGYFRNEIEYLLAENEIQDKVDLLGWVENRLIPNLLNDIRLIVVPSVYEGLPNLVLEAMACGTLVLATPVCGIPDLIRESETGFIMENNTPQCIAKNVIRSLSHPDLEQVSKNAQALIKEQYTYEAAVARYRNAMENLNINQDVVTRLAMVEEKSKIPSHSTKE